MMDKKNPFDFSSDKPMGYGSAVSTGLRNAIGEFVFFSDSDGQFDFQELPHFYLLYNIVILLLDID